VNAHARKLAPVFNESGRDEDRMDLPAEYPALFRRTSDGAVIDGVMINISNTGIGIRTSREIPLNTELDFVTLDKKIAFKVIWCSPEEVAAADNGPGATQGSTYRAYRVGLELNGVTANLARTFKWMWDRWALDHAP